MTPHTSLKHYFNYLHFRPGQEEIIQAILEGRDVLGVMPTGGGKSLCYQLPAILSEGTAICVSPLISLMKDQVDSLTCRGISAAAINSQNSEAELREVFHKLRNNDLKIIYIAPERFKSARFTDQLKGLKISFFAIDEAHCLSQWGHDFRPDYLKLGKIIHELGRPPICAFTATATPHVRDDILKVLQLNNPLMEVTGFRRPNLAFRVINAPNRASKWARLSGLVETEKKGIIYCATRKRVEEVSSQLSEWNIPHATYHAGLSDEQREIEQNRFINREVDIAVATNAFGMGIDRSDVRFIAHMEIPGSVEAYYQEAGRAGRDGLAGVCELFYNYADRRTQDFFIDGNNPALTFIRQVYYYLRKHANEHNEVSLSIQELADGLEMKNSMQVGTAIKILSREGYVERFEISGQRIKGTRLLRPEISSQKIELDESVILEKEKRDRSRLDTMVSYASSHECRQVWIQKYFGEIHPDKCEVCDICQLSDSTRAVSLSEGEFLTLQKLLSGVARMSSKNHSDTWEPNFGKGLIVQMLIGSESKKMDTLRLNKLSTYGLLRNEGAEFVRLLFEECLRRGLLCSTGGPRPLVTLTSLGDLVMKGKESIKLMWPKVENLVNKKMRSGSPLKLSAGNLDEELLKRLKSRRAVLARIRGNVPPFRIFPNQVLEDLALLQPSSVDEALAIKGIGPAKAQKLLPTFLKEINAWKLEKGY